MKATSKSPANIAFIKYWGRADHDIYLPLTTTNSMNLSNCYAVTTIEFSDDYDEDIVTIIDKNGKENNVDLTTGHKNIMLKKMLDRGREKAGIDHSAKVVSNLSFPLGTGIASSAAGLSAFVAAMYAALGLDNVVNDKKELSREVRLSGSPSAARSVEDGFTELLYGKTHEESYVEKIADPDHWNLVDLVVVVEDAEKKISSSKGHEGAKSSPLFKARLDYLKNKPEIVREAILEKDFATLAKFAERDAINMHAIMMTQDPPAYYFNSGSWEVIRKVLDLRNDGMDVFFSFDAGANPHLITTKESIEELRKEINTLSGVQFMIENTPCEGTKIIKEHNF